MSDSVMLSDVAELVMGQSPPSTSYNDTGDGLPFYQGKTDFGATYPTPRIYCREPKKLAEEGDILISVRAPVGATNLCKSQSCIGRGVAAIRANGIDRDFLYFYLKKIEAYIDSLGSGAIFKAINKSQLTELPINEAGISLPEQKKIAHILSTVQRAIEAQERIIQTTTELKKALMHKLFTEGLRNEPQKQTEIGPVPESWEVLELGEFFQIKHGFAFDGQFFEPSGEYILMTPGHFYEEGGFRDQGEKTKYFTGEIPKDYILAKDDLVVAMTEQKSGLLGSSAFVPEYGCYLHNQRLGLIVELDGNRLSKRFLFNVFNLPHFRLEVAKTSTGSKVKHTSPTKLRAVKVGIPPTLEEQDEIATAISTTERKIGVATNKKTQLQDLFRTLLHELMTAKTCVHELEITL
jgi:type I restriction enzyme S subunit